MKSKIVSIILIVFIFMFIGVSLIYGVVFPKRYLKIVEKYCVLLEVEKKDVFAIIKAESGFDKNAKSRVGAIGLMQILPSTAIFVCIQIGEDYNEEALYIPENNIKIGVHYYKYLLKKFNNKNTAIASYNAGEGNVSTWLKDKKYSDDGVTLKNIPFSETKNYLKKVNFNIKAYEFLYYRIKN